MTKPSSVLRGYQPAEEAEEDVRTKLAKRQGRPRVKFGVVAA
jgi:hypothetical protein